MNKISRMRLPTEKEIEVAQILLDIPKIHAKSEMIKVIKRYSFTWGLRKKRSVPESVSQLPLTQRSVDESLMEKVTAVKEDYSPSTPFDLLPSRSGSEGSDKCRTPSLDKKCFKRKTTLDDLMKSYNNRLQQERETLLEETKAMKTLHQEVSFKNKKLEAFMPMVNNSRSIDEKQSYKPQMTMFVPPTPQQQHCQQLVVDPTKGKLVAVHGGARFKLFNQVDPRVKTHGVTYDFMASSQPLNQSNYSVMDNNSGVRNAAAAAARQRRIMKMKENKNSFLALGLSSRGSR